MPSPAAGPSLTIPSATRLLTTFSHFLTVCIHNILFYRHLYPETTFLASRAFNFPVHQSRHPAVCGWIRDAVDAARAQIAQGAVERLAVVIYSSRGAVMERWMFDVARFPVWKGVPLHDNGKEIAWDDEQNRKRERGEYRINWVDVDEQLRAAVRKLAFSSEKLAPLPEGCTFTLAVELRDEAEAPIEQSQSWVPTEPNLQTPSRDKQTPGEDVGGERTTPLRAVEAGPLFFECWVEEGKAKFQQEPPSTMSSDR